MFKKMSLFSMAVLFAVLFVAPVSAKTVTLSSLLDEMVDRDAVTRFPEPQFVCLQASSYDRASKSPEENWFANNDTAQFLREETNGGRKEWVLMDAEGPGAIVRWWITAPHYKSVFRVYLDGNETPVIEANVGELVGGGFLTGAPLSVEKARGRNLYLPIPYEKHCKITVDDMPAQGNLYYQVNYRSYAKGTQVETFTMENFRAIKDKIDLVGKILLGAGELFAHLPPETPSTQVLIAKGAKPLSAVGRVTVPDGAVLRQLVLKVDAKDEALDHALRNTVLSIKFDDRETVWAPLGDFFGSGVGVNPYKSWYTRTEKDGTLISLWRMPFRKSMEVFFVNYGEDDVRITIKSLWAGPYDWDARSMYFHADWRQQRNIETLGGAGTMDWNYVKLQGRGVFVGDVLSVRNHHPAWWGEGDEKIYVDGETFPSHFGTGTEDYYGYAWCTPAFFEAPFHFQPRAEGPNNYGHATNGRVRLLDGIPFTKDFRFDMEVWHWAQTKIDYSVVTYWYGFADTKTVDFPSRESLLEEVQQPVLYNTPMSLDISGFTIEKAPTAGNIQAQNMQGFTKDDRKWDGNDQLWWTGAGPGAKLELLLDAEKDGKYQLVAEMTRAKDYGIVQFHVDEIKLGEAVDLYNVDVIPTGELEIGAVELTGGRHAVTVEIIGRNEKSTSHLIGIDRIRLVPAE